MWQSFWHIILVNNFNRTPKLILPLINHSYGHPTNDRQTNLIYTQTYPRVSFIIKCFHIPWMTEHFAKCIPKQKLHKLFAFEICNIVQLEMLIYSICCLCCIHKMYMWRPRTYGQIRYIPLYLYLNWISSLVVANVAIYSKY